MSGDPVNCRPVSLNQQNGNIVLSTLDTAVGTVVSFFCSQPDEVLIGPSVLQCTRAGNWNGTVPKCITASDVSSVPTENSNFTSSTELVPTARPTENQVETVVLLLWSIGGLLLVTLVVLMACIVRSHHKSRRDRANMLRANGRGNQRHGGGVNPSFTSYDEIWTWIPVVTDSQANCTSQINPSARTNCSVVTNSANQERRLLSTLRLPSYNEALSSRGTNAQNQNVRSEQPTTSQVPNNRQHIQQRNRTSAQANSQCASNTQSPIIENHYETIPADVRTLPSVYSAPNNVTHVSVTTSSGAAVSATGALALVNQTTSQSAYARAIPAMVVQSPRPDIRRHHDITRGSNAVVIGDNSSNVRDDSAGNRLSSQATTMAVVHENHANELRSGSYSIYPKYRSSQGSNQVEFRHSERSVFHYYGDDNSRRVRSDIPPYPTRHPLPPADGRHERATTIAPTSRYAQAVSHAPAMSLASEYF